MNNLIDKIKLSEGYVGTVYQDHLGIDTIGIGTRMPIDEEEAELLLRHRLKKKIKELIKYKPIILTLSAERQSVLYEMAYQLGVNGLLKFKKMWLAIEDSDFNTASKEGLASKWHRQTPNRAEKLMSILKG